MSLNKVGKPHQYRLLTELCELNSLILSMTQGDFQKIIRDITEKTDIMRNLEITSEKSRTASEAEGKKQLEVNKQNDKLLAELRAVKDAISTEKTDNDNKIEKLRSLQGALDANIADQEKRAKFLNSELDRKNKEVSEREEKINARLVEAESLKAEYAQKISDLKKITG